MLKKISSVIPLKLLTVIMLLLAGSIWLYFSEGTATNFLKMLMTGDVETLKNLVLSMGIWGPTIIMLLLVLQAVIPPIPAFVIIIVAYWLYGPVFGLLYALIGSQLGAIATFWLARILGRPFVVRLLGEKQLKQVDHFFHQYGIYAIFLARIVPVLSVDAITYAAGASNLSFKRFLIATICGQIPALLIFAIMGSKAENFLEFLGYLVIAGLVFLLTGYLIKRWLDRKHGDKEKCPE